tara:strand:- start:424 stop:1116 length:693 start_codon:yes stop_codon:yes gene_type:complete
MRVLITGHSSGLGYALSKKFKEEFHEVIGISRSPSDCADSEMICDLSKHDNLEESIVSFLKNVGTIDYVFLNAGILGEICEVHNSDINSLNKIMNVNFISNKIIIDSLIKSNMLPTVAVVAISSGAAVAPKYGWFEYCVSKAAQKILIEAYAVENDDVGFYCIAPGIVKTAMQEKIKKVDSVLYPSVKKFHDIYDKMQSPTSAAYKIYKFLPQLQNFESGEFIDMRKQDV